MKKNICGILLLLVVLVAFAGCDISRDGSSGETQSEDEALQEVNPEVPLDELLEMGATYWEAEEYGKALQAYNSAIEKDNKSEEAYKGSADALLALERPDEAAEILKKGYKKTRNKEFEEGEEAVLEGIRVLEDGIAKRKEPAIPKTVREERYDTTVDGKPAYGIYEFDKNDYKIRQTVYMSDGAIAFQVINTYDSRGDCYEKTVVLYNDGVLETYHWTSFDAIGRARKDLWYDSENRLMEYRTTNYDQDANATVHNFKYSENGILTEYRINEYDPMGNPQ